MKFPKKLHWHPFSVHFPSVLYPFAVFMMILYLVFKNNDFESVAYYTLWAASITNLFAIVSGFIDWRKKYRSNLVPVFIQKIGISLITFEISCLCVCWHYFHPDVVTAASTLSTDDVYKYIYIGLVISLAPAIGHVGHLGGKLIHN